MVKRKRINVSEFDAMLDKAMKKGDTVGIVDCYNEIGKEKAEFDDFDGAIEAYLQGSSEARKAGLVLERSFSERGLAEVYAKLGNKSKCFDHLSMFKSLSIESGNDSQIQLSLHVEAWCLQNLFDKGMADRIDLERALSVAKSSIEYLEKKRSAIAKFRYLGTIEQRKSKLLLMIAQIEQMLGNDSKALSHLCDAEHVIQDNDKEIFYEILLTRSGFAPINQRVQIARKMVKIASKERKGDALHELSHQLILNGEFDEGYKRLRETYFENSKYLHDDIVDIKSKLTILFKISMYNEELKNPTEMEKCEIYEALADLHDEYFRFLSNREKREYRHFAEENIIENYKNMIRNKRDIKDEIRGLLAIGLVYQDLNEYVNSKSIFEKRLELQISNNASIDEIIDTKISIFECMCHLKRDGLFKEFENLKKQTRTTSSRKELFFVWADYLEEMKEIDDAKYCRNIAEGLNDSPSELEDDGTDKLFGNWSEDKILKECKVEHEKLAAKEKAMLKKDRQNNTGETELHNAAKVDNPEMVEHLCQQGYSVNVVDNAGWTPLSEAVNHENYENVAILIRYGADVNIASKEGFENSSSRREVRHTRLTPLMEACAQGFEKIAKLLIENGAKLEKRDSLGYSAYNHLEEYIRENGYTEEQKLFKVYFEELMKERNVSLNVAAPRAVLEETQESNTQRMPAPVQPSQTSPIIRDRKRMNRSSAGSENSVKRKPTSPTPPLSTKIISRQNTPDVIEMRTPVRVSPPSVRQTTPLAATAATSMACCPVRVFFVNPPNDQIKNMMWSLPRQSTIADLRRKILSYLKSAEYEVRLQTHDGTNMEYSDEVLLAQIGDDVKIDCLLEMGSAAKIYSNSKGISRFILMHVVVLWDLVIVCNIDYSCTSQFI
ncbi:unnamed protein product [Caenorhabditis bovis]|uniref:ANK_REP_REGION domain-containing protein n=1 Tax=Caenorhabditis bovis TaxID=2654633 RepID=A0A8S1F425_9PELO|nr:unnamed protein product [Caenorhabditis bovis]